jgi:hypothetical protein
MPTQIEIFAEALKRINDKFQVGEPITARSNEGIVLFEQFEKVWANNLDTLLKYAQNHTESETRETFVKNCYAWLAQTIVQVWAK